MSFQFVSSLYDLFVKRMFYVVLNGNNDRLIHLVADNLPRTGFSQISLFHGLSPFDGLQESPNISSGSSSLCDQSLNARNIFSYFFDPACIVQLVCGILEPQVEEFLLSSY